MSATLPPDLTDFSMMELFRLEVNNQAAVLAEHLIGLEHQPVDPSRLEVLMRAAHSLKGAARMVNCEAAVRLAHAMEEVFVAAQTGRLVLLVRQVDVLLRGVDLMQQIAQMPENGTEAENGPLVPGMADYLVELDTIHQGNAAEPPRTPPFPAAVPPETVDTVPGTPTATGLSAKAAEKPAAQPRFLRVTAANLNRLLALTGESLIASRRLEPLAGSLLRVQRQLGGLSKTLDAIHEALGRETPVRPSVAHVHQARTQLSQCRRALSERLLDLEDSDQRSAHLSHRLYNEALACRMRPFGDGLLGFPRMVRDLARTLGKQARLEIQGPNTYVDRDILEKLEAPLTHLVRNAFDHGIEPLEERRAAGKPDEGVIRLEARHSAGDLLVSVSDDGAGIDLAGLRGAVVRKQLTTAAETEKMSSVELLDFLLLPGFTMKQTVTEISGRGVGLDVVQALVKEVRGVIRITTERGTGTTFQLQLPLTLSIVRALLVQIESEPYAFPLAHVARAFRLPKEGVRAVGGRQYFSFDGQQIGLVSASQIFGGGGEAPLSAENCVLIIGQAGRLYGLVVEKFLGERELIVQPLDPRLGKIKDISCGALMEDGAPVLVVEVADAVRSIEKLVETGTLTRIQREDAREANKKRKRILVVDDSLTVRELEKKLLQTRGYEVEIAVDGMDGWNAVRTGKFDLVVTDVDMPRQDGIELVSLIKRDPGLTALPVIIVSYKDREEDRRRGLEAGADHYLAKGSFHDETLLVAVVNLIGEATG
ncbi:MAG TPA: hybrid sensor histidine kinase/response regulator [Chthoniobacterales bacterium]